MRRRPIPILLALALAVGLAPAAAQALPESAVVHEAATKDELVAAAAAVNADDTGAPQTIRLTGDIAFDGSSNNELVFTRDVTLLGGGHSSPWANRTAPTRSSSSARAPSRASAP